MNRGSNVSSTSGGGTYKYGQSVWISGSPYSHYHMTDNRYVTVNGNASYTVNAAIDTYDVYFTNTSNVKIVITVDGVDYEQTYKYNIPYGTSVKVKITPKDTVYSTIDSTHRWATRYTYSGCTGDYTTSWSSFSLSMSKDYRISVNSSSNKVKQEYREVNDWITSITWYLKCKECVYDRNDKLKSSSTGYKVVIIKDNLNQKYGNSTQDPDFWTIGLSITSPCTNKETAKHVSTFVNTMYKYYDDDSHRYLEVLEHYGEYITRSYYGQIVKSYPDHYGGVDVSINPTAMTWVDI